MATILIVEDEVFIAEVAKMTIEDMGHDALVATDIDEALILLRAPQQIDALFTDLRLKTAAFSGYAVADQARKLRPQLRVLYSSGSAMTDKTRALFVEGAHFLQKPYSQARLASAIEVMLAVPEAPTRSTPSP